MARTELGDVLIEQKQKVGTVDGDNLPLIGVSNKDGLIQSKQSRLADVSKYKILKKDWFAYNPMRINVGSIGLAGDDVLTGIISPDYVVFSCTERILPEYFLQYIKSDLGLLEIKKLTGGSVRERLYFKNLAKISIELPSIEEQETILKSLKISQSAYNQIKNDISSLIDFELKHIQKEIFQTAISGTLVNQNLNEESADLLYEKILESKQIDNRSKKLAKKHIPLLGTQEIPFNIPENWKWCRLGDLGIINPRNHVADGVEASFISMNDISAEYGVIPLYQVKLWQDIKNGFTHFQEQDVAFAKITPCFENSKACIFKGLKNGIGSGTTELHVFRGNNEHILSEYVYIFFKTPYFLMTGESKMTGSAGQKRVSRSFFENIPFPLPPVAEQQRIVDKIHSLNKILKDIENDALRSHSEVSLLLQLVMEKAYGQRKILSNLNEKPLIDNVLILAAEIIWQLHKKQTFGHVKLQKLLFLCERTQNMKLPVKFLKQAMGPYDPKLQRYLDVELEKRAWFKYDEKESFKYQPLKNAGGHKHAFNVQLGDRVEAIYHLIQLFENTNSSKIEIVATLFACWEEMIMNNQLVNDASLLNKFYDWSEFKGNYSTEQVKSALRWMENNSVTPQEPLSN